MADQASYITLTDTNFQSEVLESSEPVLVESGSIAGAYACYLRDPDGFTIELVQPPTQAPA